MIKKIVFKGLDVIKYYLLNQWKDKLEADKKLFFKIKEILPSDSDAIYYLKHFNGKGAYRQEWFTALRIIERELKKPDSFFFDNDLEIIKTKLVLSINNFINLIDTHTFDFQHNFYKLPEEWTETQPKRYKNAYKDINIEVDSILDNYNSLIIIGKEKLKI